MPIQKLVARRFCTPIKNAAVCAVLHAHLASLARPCPVGSKKSSSASSLTYHPARPGPRGSHFHDAGTGRTDGSFALKKAHDCWIWIALCRKTRQVVAYAVGDRSKKTCQRLWEAIPESYRTGHCFTSFWAAYAAVIPEEQHIAVGKETGETAHVERWNKTLRQRLARFVRMTLSFSKSVVMLRPRVFSSFSIAPIESGPSCSSEPLPKIDRLMTDFLSVMRLLSLVTEMRVRLNPY